MPCLFFIKRRVRRLASLTLVVGLLSSIMLTGWPRVSAASPSPTVTDTPAAAPLATPGTAFRQSNLISDLPGVATVQDPLLVNPWGISFGTMGPFWVANSGSSTSTLYRGGVGTNPVVINPGLPSITIPGNLPTGTVANITDEFVIGTGSATGPARFIFASLTGNITAWNTNVPAAGSRAAQVVASPTGRVYTGLAISNLPSGNFLYAADFANKKIDVFNNTFALTTLAGNFTDPTIPADYAPFNIQRLGNILYVAYAKVGSNGMDEAGPGNGYVSTFDLNGNFLARIISQGALNSPWGLAIAPASFGNFGNALLVGNFGDGRINAFNPTTGASLGALCDESGEAIVIEDLWALTFGNGAAGGDQNTLYFAAGIFDEKHGLFGSLTPVATASASLVQFSASDYVIGEGTNSIQLTVTRTGDVSSAATINYATVDGTSETTGAKQTSDYESALGTLNFSPGETSKTFKVLLVNDVYVESSETLHLVLSNPTGAAGLGSPNTATLTILDNDTAAPTSNPIDMAEFFVRQHYHDFLNREPDPSGFDFWVKQITSCETDVACIEVKRINVSAAFFLSLEFQRTGFLVYRAHQASFGMRPLYGQFLRDTQAVGRGVIFGQPGSPELLEANTVAYFNELVARPEFVTRYPASQTNEQFVDALLTSAGLAPSPDFRASLVSDLNAGRTRAQVLRRVAENDVLTQRERNPAFVYMEYAGYLRRDPDTEGFDFWLRKLNDFNGNFIAAEMVKAFILSEEYRERFGPNN